MIIFLSIMLMVSSILALVAVYYKEKTINVLNEKNNKLKIANDIASDQIAKSHDKKIEVMKELRHISSLANESHSLYQLVLGNLTDKLVSLEKSKNTSEKFIEQLENKLEQRELFCNMEITCLEQLLQDEKNKVNLLRLDYGDKLAIYDDDYTKKLVRALKAVEPNKLAIINQGHAIGTVGLGVTKQGDVVLTTKPKSKYTNAGHVIREVIYD